MIFFFFRTDPNPPRDMTIEKVTSNSVLVHWLPPKKSEFSSYVIRYRTESEKEWFNLPSVTTTEADVEGKNKIKNEFVYVSVSLIL